MNNRIMNRTTISFEFIKIPYHLTSFLDIHLNVELGVYLFIVDTYSNYKDGFLFQLLEYKIKNIPLLQAICVTLINQYELIMYFKRYWSHADFSTHGSA